MYGHLSCAVVPKIYVGRLLALRFLETSRNHSHLEICERKSNSLEEHIYRIICKLLQGVTSRKGLVPVVYGILSCIGDVVSLD